jgi:hypothetical protein
MATRERANRWSHRALMRLLEWPSAEQLNANPNFAGVAIEVEQIDDHRPHAFEVDSGRRWLNVDGRAVRARLPQTSGTQHNEGRLVHVFD